MPDPVTLLRTAVRPPAGPDLVVEVRQRLRRRRRARLSALALGTVTLVAASAAVWSGWQQRAQTALTTTASNPRPSDAPLPLSTAKAPLTGKDATDTDEDRYPPGRSRLSVYVNARPDVFTGQYEDRADWVVVLGPAAAAEGVERWRDELTRVGGGTPLRVEVCDVSASDLREVQAQIRELAWPSGPRPAYAVEPNPRTCTVDITSDELSKADLALVEARFGTRVRHLSGAAGRARTGRTP